MSVKLTSPVLGQGVDYIYTGTMEAWLLAEGFAKRDADTTPTSYVGPGTANTGPTDVVPANDPTLPANRGDKAHFHDRQRLDQPDGGVVPQPRPPRLRPGRGR